LKFFDVKLDVKKNCYVCLKRRDVDNVRETKSLLLRTTPNASSRGHLNVFNTVDTHNMH
jgi:hypothetical protein